MNIKESAREILEACRMALGEVGNKYQNNEALGAAAAKLDAIGESLSNVVDCTSKDAAKKERELFEALDKWSKQIAIGNFRDPGANKAIDEAVKVAERWTALNPGGRVKEAKPEEIKEAGDLNADTINLANANECAMMLSDVISRIEVEKKNYEQIASSAYEEQELKGYRAEIEEAEQRKNRAFADCQMGKMSMEEAYEIMTECDAEMKDINSEVRKLEAEIKRNKARGRTYQKELRRFVRICKGLQKYRSNTAILSEIAKNIDFVAINEFLNGSVDTLVIDKVVNLKAIGELAGKILHQSAESFIRELDNEDRLYETEDRLSDREGQLNENDEEKRKAEMMEYMQQMMNQQASRTDASRVSAPTLTETPRRVTLSEDDN